MTCRNDLRRELRTLATSATPRALASTLLSRLGIASAPVPLHRIAEALGAKVELVPSPQYEGWLEYRNGCPHISINAEHALVRQRFTLAHELGHLLMHSEGKRFRDEESSRARSPEEREANSFAAHLLMPLELLDAEAKKLGYSAAALALRFNVSRAALERQMPFIVPGL